MVLIKKEGLSSSWEIYSVMRRAGINHEVAWRTAAHEKAHANADRGNSGEFGLLLDIQVTDSFMFASFIAYYRPLGQRSPEDMMAIAIAPGASEMSSQDKKVYDAAYRNWISIMRSEKDKAEAREGENKGKVPALIAVPRGKDEGDEEYKNKIYLVKKFADQLKKFEEDGRIPKLSDLLSRNFSEIGKNTREEIKSAYEQALIQVIHEKKNRKEPKLETPNTRLLHPLRRLDTQKS